MKRLIAAILLTLTLIVYVACTRETVLVFEGRTMGTWYTVKVYGADQKKDQEKIQQSIDTALEKVNTCLNTYDPKSEISRFNEYNGKEIFTLSDEFMNVGKVAQMIYEKSNGAFDPTIKKLVKLWGFGENGVHKRPDEQSISDALEHVGLYKLKFSDNGIQKKDPLVTLDFSAIAKGYGVDAVVKEIAALGYNDILVEIGGEVKTIGKQRKIGIAVPAENNVGNQRSAEIITLKNIACATSGDYQQFYIENGERFSHLINPKTGYPIRHDLTSVTVIAEGCMLADAAATAAIVLGKTKGLDFIESLEGVEAFFIYHEGNILRPVTSSGWVW
jgi:thiamine biosynthesis lipoprotein